MWTSPTRAVLLPLQPGLDGHECLVLSQTEQQQRHQGVWLRKHGVASKRSPAPLFPSCTVPISSLPLSAHVLTSARRNCEVRESLHKVCDALAPCLCGWCILEKCRGCFSLLWRPAALLCVPPSDAECHRPRFLGLRRLALQVL